MSYLFDMNCSFHHIYLLKQHMISTRRPFQEKHINDSMLIDDLVT